MRPKVTRWRIAWLSAGAAVALLLVIAFVAPPAHDVHTSDGLAIKAHVAYPNPSLPIFAMKPSESLGDIRCQQWRADFRNPQRADPCPDDATLAKRYWSQLVQTPNTLYLAFPPSCAQDVGGQSVDYGFNAEYLGSSRTVILHCYYAKPWFIWHTSSPMGTAAIPPIVLLLVPTNGISSGPLSILEDYRIEHLVGDWSNESTIGTATIS